MQGMQVLERLVLFELLCNGGCMVAVSFVCCHYLLLGVEIQVSLEHLYVL